MAPLTRLRDTPDYDDLTDAEHVAVLDAAELLDELRPQGYGFALVPGGRLRVTPPAGADKDVQRRVVALADAIYYLLRLERWTDPLPEVCRSCQAPVWAYSPNGHPYCEEHYQMAEQRAQQKLQEASEVRLRAIPGAWEQVAAQQTGTRVWAQRETHPEQWGRYVAQQQALASMRAAVVSGAA